MPISYQLPEYQDAFTIEDVNKYEKLPFWLAMLEARMFPEWQTYDKLFGHVNWTPNMGSVMRGVRAEPLPVSQVEFYPKVLTSLPNKNVVETMETSADAVLHWHDFDSKYFHFLPHFQDFRKNQLEHNHKELVRHIAVSNDIFIRSAALQKAPSVFVVGNTTPNEKHLISAPVVANGTAITEDTIVKDDNWFASIVAKIGSNLTLAALDYLVNVMRDDLGAPFFEGTVNTPKDNELIKGKYVFIGSLEAFQYLKWDPNFERFRDVTMSVTTGGFHGSIFNQLTYKPERHPIRFKADGTRPAPQLTEAGTNRTRPNPEYVNAPFEMGKIVAADAFKTIKVGPPPKAFSAKSMTKEKFYSMRWNGEVQLTDQVVIKYPDGTIDINRRGRFLQLISTANLGLIPQNEYNYLPVVYKRARAPIE